MYEWYAGPMNDLYALIANWMRGVRVHWYLRRMQRALNSLQEAEASFVMSREELIDDSNRLQHPRQKTIDRALEYAEYVYFKTQGYLDWVDWKLKQSENLSAERREQLETAAFTLVDTFELLEHAIAEHDAPLF